MAAVAQSSPSKSQVSMRQLQAKDVTVAKPRGTNEEFRRHTRGQAGRLASGVCTTLAIAFIIIPLVAFAFAAILTVPLWQIECNQAGEDHPVACEYYQWFLYIMGNLVGLATPLTNVSPTSNHMVAVMLDLIISVWALSLAGTAIGVVGGLGAVSQTSLALERSVHFVCSCKWAKRIAMLSSPVASNILQLEDFIREMRDLSRTDCIFEGELSDAQLTVLFEGRSDDMNSEGRKGMHVQDVSTIRGEVRSALDKQLINNVIRMQPRREEACADPRLDARMNALDAEVGELRNLVTRTLAAVEELKLTDSSRARISSSVEADVMRRDARMNALDAEMGEMRNLVTRNLAAVEEIKLIDSSRASISPSVESGVMHDDEHVLPADFRG